MSGKAKWLLLDNNEKEAFRMDYVLNTAQADEVLCALKKDYCVYAPKRFLKEGRFSDTDIIRYDQVDHVSEIVWDAKMCIRDRYLCI